MTCIECKFYADNCECHRFPPMAQQYSDAMFPLVGNNNWCGEFVALKTAEPSNDAPGSETPATGADAAPESETAGAAANVESKPKRKYDRRKK